MTDLSKLTMTEDIQEEKDTLGGNFATLESGLYDLTIKLAFTSVSKGGALALNLHAETSDGILVREQLWITSGKAKGCKNFYVDKKGNKQYLPGFNQANALCLLTVGKTIDKMETESKVVNLYDAAAGGEIPTKVDMLTELLGKEITAGIMKKIENKTKRNDTTGKYEPTADLRTFNEINKLFRKRDGLTVAEIKAKATEAVFMNKWAVKNNGKVIDKSVEVKATTGTKVNTNIGTTVDDADSLFA